MREAEGRQALLLRHPEDISWQVMEEYLQVVREMSQQDSFGPSLFA